MWRVGTERGAARIPTKMMEFISDIREVGSAEDLTIFRRRRIYVDDIERIRARLLVRRQPGDVGVALSRCFHRQPRGWIKRRINGPTQWIRRKTKGRICHKQFVLWRGGKSEGLEQGNLVSPIGERNYRNPTTQLGYRLPSTLQTLNLTANGREINREWTRIMRSRRLNPQRAAARDFFISSICTRLRLPSSLLFAQTS